MEQKHMGPLIQQHCDGMCVCVCVCVCVCDAAGGNKDLTMEKWAL